MNDAPDTLEPVDEEPRDATPEELDVALGETVTIDEREDDDWFDDQEDASEDDSFPEDVDSGPDGEELPAGPTDMEGEADAGPSADPIDSEDSEPVATLPTDEDGYIDTSEVEKASEETVVVQDFDPSDPGAEIAEPQKVFHPHDRIARKRARGSRE